MSEFKGDYLGFSYGTKTDGTPMHSSDLGIVRVSDGSRFNENLLPTMQDKTVQVPGGDGTYYFGSYYTQRQFNISFAFDALTETDIARLKTHFGDKKIHDLIFDETPYKVYSAKVTGTASIKYLAFDEGSGRERIYKGEGSIQFTCYTPFARSKFKFLDEYENIENINEWATASGLKATQGSFDIYNQTTGQINLFNPGDFNAHFTLTLFFNDYEDKFTIPAGSISLPTGESLSWNAINRQKVNDTWDTYIVISSKLNLIYGGEGGKKTGTIYNQYIDFGDFFTIPQGNSTLTLSSGAKPTEGEKRVNIKYDYCYY